MKLVSIDSELWNRKAIALPRCCHGVWQTLLWFLINSVKLSSSKNQYRVGCQMLLYKFVSYIHNEYLFMLKCRLNAAVTIYYSTVKDDHLKPILSFSPLQIKGWTFQYDCVILIPKVIIQWGLQKNVVFCIESTDNTTALCC